MARAWVTYTAMNADGTPDWSLTAGVACKAEHPDAMDQCETRARRLHTESLADLRGAEAPDSEGTP